MRIIRTFIINLLLFITVQTVVEAQNTVSSSEDFKGLNYIFHLTGDLKGFKAKFSTRTDQKGIEYLVLNLKAAKKISPAPLSLRWSLPVKDIQGTWNPARNFNKYLNPIWKKDQAFQTGATTNAPVTAFYNFNNRSRLTFACSDALNSLKIITGVNESTAMIDCDVQLFTQSQPDIDGYELVIRLDTRDLPFWETLSGVAKWWEAMPAYKANVSPEATRLPMYSTWYSFHQKLETKAVEEQCRLAKAMGCETVIVDDGWQTLDSNLGYAYTGDWTPDRIPDMKGHVARVHQLGMKFMLWYSVPFVGEKSKIYPKFKGKYLYFSKSWGAYALDPRFPEVRQYLIDKYVSALCDWNLDGFKLDFVDSFLSEGLPVAQQVEGRDYASINAAVDKLLTDVMAQLRAIKPDIMVEFRQSYVGPLMRKYGNMFRAADAPDDPLSNRVRTIDVRLLSAGTAAHSDMLMWHKEEKVEVAALQFLNILFSVPQISVKINELPVPHQEMLKFWLKFWRDNRDVILDGNFMPENPDQNYPQVTAVTAEKQLTAVYSPKTIVEIKNQMRENVMIVNANHGTSIVLKLSASAGTKNIRVFDCRGKQIRLAKRILGRGLHQIEVPASGLLQIK